MTQLLTVLLLLPALLSAQKPDCTPHRGTTVVCDSVYQLCRKSAYQVALISISKPESKWYDSLYCPQQLVTRYTDALCAFYNDLPDTLADFRMYLQHLSRESPDCTFTTTVYVPHRAMDTVFDRHSATGSARIDSLMTACGFELVSTITLHSLARSVVYRHKKNVNRALIERRLRAIHPQVTMTGVYKSSVYSTMEISEEADQLTLHVTEHFACMPPEIPCRYIRRTFVYEEERPLRQTKFERGTVPWPHLPGED